MGDDQYVKAQTLSDNTEPSQGTSSLTNNFQPSLAVVIGMLAVMFSLTFVLLLYAKFCHRASSVNTTSRGRLVRTRTTTPPPPSLASGVDKTVIESLPFFRFSSLKGSREGLECSVCLAKFLEVDILRLLPKCKHAFHMDCIDQWLEKHSTCPLCRRKVSADDLSHLPCSSSFRFLFNHESNLELYIEREASRRHGSSSFRKTQIREDELPIQLSVDSGDVDVDVDVPLHHKFNHRINVVSDVVLRNRWSDVTSADLVFLNSEMLGDVSSARFEEEGKLIREINTSSSASKDKRSMSEIIHHPRFITDQLSSSDKEERIRKLWLPIARKTAHCFANRQLVITPPQ